MIERTAGARGEVFWWYRFGESVCHVHIALGVGSIRKALSVWVFWVPLCGECGIVV
jgi:hypothetical protein